MLRGKGINLDFSSDTIDKNLYFEISIFNI